MEDSLAAYNLDRAVLMFGRAYEEALRVATSQGKRKRPLTDAQRAQKINEVNSRWLGISTPKRYRDPALNRSSRR